MWGSMTSRQDWRKRIRWGILSWNKMLEETFIDIIKLYLDITSIFFARLGNRDNHFINTLFLLQWEVPVNWKYFSLIKLQTFWWLGRLQNCSKHHHCHCQKLLCSWEPPVSSETWIICCWWGECCNVTLASDLIAALTAVYSSSAKNTKKMQTPVHKSTACSEVGEWY